MLLLEAAGQLTLYTCCTTNWPKMHISRSFVNLKLILRRTATAKRPKTAPEAPRQTLLWGIDSHDAKLPPAWEDSERSELCHMMHRSTQCSGPRDVMRSQSL